ncbi:MAG: hypothetical protein ACLQIB_24560 [Isosphaeraceae bacterium]
MSATHTPLEQKSVSSDGPRGADLFHNPSYPARTHFQERQELEESLRVAEERVSAAGQKLTAVADHPEQAALVRLYHQMMGARDQIADCVRRIPLEAAGLYEEDKERYVQADAALERTWRKWQAAGG